MRIPLLALLCAVSSVVTAAEAPFGPHNPFYSPSTLPFQAPPFDRIAETDYRPALEAGMRTLRAEIRRIAADPAAPTFENTLLALERSGRLLDRAQHAFDAVSAANTDEVLQAAKAALAPELAATHDAIYLDAGLFARVAAVYAQRATRPVGSESRRLIEVTYQEFVRSGARLSTDDKATLRKLNREASTLADDFSRKLLAATRAAAFTAATPAQLAGLSEPQLAAAQEAAQQRKVPGYVLVLQNTTQQPALAALEQRQVRQQLFENSWGRTERGGVNDTRATLARLAQLRAQSARLLGFPSYAAWKLEDQMAKTPQTALDFLDALRGPVTARALRERADIQARADSGGEAFKVEAWDWNYYAEQVRKARYDLDDAELKPYFELGRVLVDGVFYAATQLYGITFTERNDIPVYQPEVRVFEVRDADGRPLALFYCDYFKRDNKNGGAWMSTFVEQSSLLGTRPVIYNVANLPKPAAGEPALISFEDVTTMFHEFGHALHGLFADTRYPRLSGTSTARDFVEFPSQFNEHWALSPSVFAHYAVHYQTGRPMPAALVEKLKAAATFNQGYRLAELLEAAQLDMQWHTLAASAPLQDADAFETAALARTQWSIDAVPPRYRSSYFSHIWAGGYAAGYYAYLWTQMLADDAFQWFDEHGGLTRANGDRLRRQVLSRGNTRDLAALYAAWRGRAPSVEAMMKYRGLE